MLIHMLEPIKHCHNPYFNRWFSAIFKQQVSKEDKKSHNPYFNRWFSAIKYDYAGYSI